MDNFLIHTFSIKNHPISELKDDFKMQYVMGLGEFMCYMSKKDSRARLVFEVWARSITSVLPTSCWQCTNDFSLIKTAISLKRDGLHFFSMRRIFFFDCFYLTSLLNKKLSTYSYSFLNEHINGILSRHVLKDVYSNREKSTQRGIPSQLLSHKQKNEIFLHKPLKKVLVVATMTAGKSTLINAITGFHIHRVEATACTKRISYLYNKPVSDGFISKGIDACYKFSYKIAPSALRDFNEAALHFKSLLSNERVCFIDTPGVNYSRAAKHQEITHRTIKENNYDAILFVSNSNYFGTNDELDLLKFTLKQSRKPIIFVLNKVDTFRLKHDSIEKMIRDFEIVLSQLKCYSKVIPISAEAAFYSKQNPNFLDRDELNEYVYYKKKFENIYYDLPSYCEDVHTNKFIDRTGITLVEQTIKKIIQ
ncbi:MAG: dynamin family protein [Prevotella sp.]|nr:dynamin family protein [Prevotella sp.]